MRRSCIVNQVNGCAGGRRVIKIYQVIITDINRVAKRGGSGSIVDAINRLRCPGTFQRNGIVSNDRAGTGGRILKYSLHHIRVIDTGPVVAVDGIVGDIDVVLSQRIDADAGIGCADSTPEIPDRVAGGCSTASDIVVPVG